MSRLLVALILLGGCDALFRLDHIAASSDAPAPFAAAYIARFVAPRATNAPEVSFQIDLPEASNTLLVVSLELAMTSNNLSEPPQVTSLTYDVAPLRSIASISSSKARCEQWMLVAPAPGLHEINVAFAAATSTIHASAMVFGGIDQQTPVRATNSIGDEMGGITADMLVPSADGDLVESTVGQGTSITNSFAGQTRVYLDNGSEVNALDNAAGSYAKGADAGVAMGWIFGGNDTYLMLAASLESAP